MVVMDDTQWLLHLEALKRNSDEGKNVQRQVEELARNWIEAKYEFQKQYARLATLIKQVGVRQALDAKPCVDDSRVRCTASDAASISAKVTNDKLLARLDEGTLAESKVLLLAAHKPRRQLAKQQRNAADNRETLKALRATLESVENKLETATLHSMDQLVKEVQPAANAALGDENKPLF